MRATGKTTIGQLLALALGRNLIETDELVATKAGIPISDLVQKHGWEYFRDLEAQAIEEISNLDNTVISTGGGAVLREENVQLLKKEGFLILLTASTDTMTTRIENNKPRPPLTTKNSLREEITAVLAQRRPLYEKACDMQIQTDSQSPHIVTKKIVDIIKEKNI